MSEAVLPPPALTADLIARAIIAAALAYGDDPVKVLTAQRGLPKRSLPAVLAGLAAIGADMARARDVLGCRRDVVARAQKRGQLDPEFQRAVQAAERAARFAAWRPEARASVVAGQADDRLAPAGVDLPPPAVTVRRVPALTAKSAFSRKPKAASAPAAVKAAAPAPARKVADVSYEDAIHLQHIRNANGGLGFPAVVKAR